MSKYRIKETKGKFQCECHLEAIGGCLGIYLPAQTFKIGPEFQSLEEAKNHFRFYLESEERGRTKYHPYP